MKLQTEQEDEIGFIAQSKLQTKLKHKQYDQVPDETPPHQKPSVSAVAVQQMYSIDAWRDDSRR